MSKKKYKLTDETIKHKGKVLRRIEALKDFADVKKGDKGGYVQSEENLSQEEDCWISDNAKVYDNAKILGNSIIYGNALIYGNAKIYGNTEIKSDAKIENNTDYIVFKNWWSSGRYFTWTKSNNMWKVGCFYGTGKELIEKAYKDSELSGREYKRVVDYVESILKDNR